MTATSVSGLLKEEGKIKHGNLRLTTNVRRSCACFPRVASGASHTSQETSRVILYVLPD